MELSDAAFSRLCELLDAKKSDENHMVGFSLAFTVADEKLMLTFLLDQLVVLWPWISRSAPDAQFLFKCNRVEIDPRSTVDRYMVCFTYESDCIRLPRMLIAGGANRVSHIRLYSIPGTSTTEEFQFPDQL